jgi:hypothetical protein
MKNTAEIADKPAYTVAEVAALMGLSRQKVTAMFENESGVIIIESPTRMRKRRHRTIRIPRAVYLRVLGRVVKAMRH